MEKIQIINAGNTYTYTPVVKKDGEWSPCGYRESVFTGGSTCEVSLALNDADQSPYLIKKYNHGYSGELAKKNTSILKMMSNNIGDNYVLGQVLIGDGQIYKERERVSEQFAFEVFGYFEGDTIRPYKEERNIFQNPEALFKILSVMDSLLVSLKNLHEAGFVHCDVKPDNIFQFQINERCVAQLIDIASCKPMTELIDTIRSGADFHDLEICSTEPYYSEDDWQALCNLKGQELERNIRALDLTAAAHVFFYMLGIENEQEQEQESFNEGFQTALKPFLSKFYSGSVTKRFSDAEEMRCYIAGMIAAISQDLSKTVWTEKMKAISINPIINDLRDKYMSLHSSDDFEKRRDEIWISDILKNIDRSILPHIYADGRKYANFEEFLKNKAGNYFITGSGGPAKRHHCFLNG